MIRKNSNNLFDLNVSETFNFNNSNSDSTLNFSNLRFQNLVRKSSFIDNFTISCFNTHGFKSNLAYLDQILNFCDILFISETWLLESEFFLFKNLNSNFNIYNKSDMQFKPSHGRPFGSRSWFINKKKFSNVSVEFLNDRISVLTFTKYNCFFAFIGVYLPFFNNTNTNLFEFESSLILINEISNSFFNKKYTVVTLGDFNCDHSRNNKFDALLKSFISHNNFQVIDTFLSNSSDFTFSNSVYSHFIDHIFIYNNVTISDFSSYVDHSDINLCDHDPIFTKLIFNNSFIASDKFNNDDKIDFIMVRPNLENDEINFQFQMLVDTSFADFYKNINFNCMSNKIIINCWYEAIYNAILPSYDKLSFKVLKNQVVHTNYWFTDELKLIKKEIMYVKYNQQIDEVDKKIQIKHLKNKFRFIQRKNMVLMKDKHYFNIEKLCKEDKNKF